MGRSKEIAFSNSAAGGGSPHAAPADLSSPVLQNAISTIDRSVFSSIQQDLGSSVGPSSLEELTAYLADPQNAAIARIAPKDWSHPLNEYFISSSHNTYLTGHQLYGKSTTEGYINVLERGCRCIEIDVWDGDDGEPEVFHGYTLTKEIKFKDVCKAIKKHSFSNGEEAGEGPVIISLECHCSPKMQLKMVKIMEEIWGDMLVKDIEPEAVTSLPSPDYLRRKIIVKAKYIAPPAVPEPISTTEPRDPPAYIDDTSSSSDSEMEAMSKAANKKKPKKSKVIRAFARLGAYCSSHHFPGPDAEYPDPFIGHPTSQIPNHVYSFSEKVFAKHQETYSHAIFEHNKQFLMRVYPFGLRFSSSNADPTEFWKRGVQLVALNWQKNDEGMMLNEGMFSGEGGYVLKPPGFRPGDGPIEFKHLDLIITIMAAANIPLPDEDDSIKGFKPYVKVELHTAQEDHENEIKRKTKSKRGIECVWDETVEFMKISHIVEKLTFVRFKIHDSEFGKDDLSSWACIRLDRLQQGFRVVRLFDSEGLHSRGVILVKISKSVY